MEAELKKRVVTAGVLSGVLLVFLTAAAWWDSGRWWLMAFSFIACGFAAFEFARIAAGSPPQRLRGVVYFTAAFLPALGQFVLYSGLCLNDPHLAQKGAAALLALFFAGEMIGGAFMVFSAKETLADAENAIKEVAVGVFLVGFCGGALMALCILPLSFQALLWLLITVCANDIAAYFVGKQLGGRKLAPVISPGKTVSGTVGGLLCGVAAGLLVSGLIPGQLSWVQAALVTLLAVCAAQLGDLLKSYLKRLRGVKDSGSILPGHGGVLDRVDAVLAAAPVLYCWLLWHGG